jgi:hypothetical protein
VRERGERFLSGGVAREVRVLALNPVWSPNCDAASVYEAYDALSLHGVHVGYLERHGAVYGARSSVAH